MNNGGAPGDGTGDGKPSREGSSVKPTDEYIIAAGKSDPTAGDVARSARRQFLIRGTVAGPFIVTLSSRPVLAKKVKGKQSLKLSHRSSREPHPRKKKE